MAADNKQFAADITRWVNAAKGNVDKVVRKVVFDMGAAIIMRTPIDKGHLCANWQFGDGKMPEGELSVFDVSGSATISRLKTEMQGIKAGTIHYIVNNVPYAANIEYGLYPNPPKNPTGKTVGGFSKKAPQGMVRVTVLEYQSYLNNAVVKAS